MGNLKSKIANLTVPVAQPDRASDFGSEGWGFESLQARSYENTRLLDPDRDDLLPLCCPYFCCVPAQDRVRIAFAPGLIQNSCQMQSEQPAHICEVRPRKDKRGVDLISDALPFGRLWP